MAASATSTSDASTSDGSVSALAGTSVDASVDADTLLTRKLYAANRAYAATSSRSLLKACSVPAVPASTAGGAEEHLEGGQGGRLALRGPRPLLGNQRKSSAPRQDPGPLLLSGSSLERQSGATGRYGGASARLRGAVAQQITTARVVQQMRQPTVDARRASRAMPMGLPPPLESRPSASGGPKRFATEGPSGPLQSPPPSPPEPSANVDSSADDPGLEQEAAVADVAAVSAMALAGPSDMQTPGDEEVEDEDESIRR